MKYFFTTMHLLLSFSEIRAESLLRTKKYLFSLDESKIQIRAHFTHKDVVVTARIDMLRFQNISFVSTSLLHFPPCNKLFSLSDITYTGTFSHVTEFFVISILRRIPRVFKK